MVVALSAVLAAVSTFLLTPVVQAADLKSVLAGQANLTTFRDVLEKHASVFADLPKDITIVVPNDNGFNKFIGEWEKYNTTQIEQTLRYHILKKSVSMTSIEKGDSAYAATELTDDKWTTVTGGQHLILTKQPGGEVVFTSGFAQRGTVVVEDLKFDNGLIQIADSVMRIPENLEQTARRAYNDLEAFVGALYTADLMSEVTKQKDVTIFAPRNAAFQQLAGTFEKMDKETLKRVLRYHIVPGKESHIWELKNTTVLNTADNGNNITITRHTNFIYVNSAEIIQTDILISNGLVHMIDNVLNPLDNDARPDTTRTAAQVPVFTLQGETATGTSVPTPFTTALPCMTSCPVTGATDAGSTPTGAATTAQAAGTSKSTNAAAAPRCTGLVGAGVGVGLAVGAMMVGL